MNFPPLCLPSMLLSSGKYLNTRNKCHCLSLTVEQMGIVESTVTWCCFCLSSGAFEVCLKAWWSTFRTPYSCEISRPTQLSSSCKEGGQRWLNDGERKSRSWPPDRYGKFWPSSSCVESAKRQRHLYLPAQLRFNNVLLWNCNIAGRHQLSCTPCLWDIAGFLCNKGRKWKHTKSNHIWSNKQFFCWGIV